MKVLKTTSLSHAPSKAYVEAAIVALTPEVVDLQIHRSWWNDPSLKAVFDREPIDRHWDWSTDVIEYNDQHLKSEKVGIFSGDAGDLQGAMMISTDAVQSVLEPGKGALFVERLFTAPRNRPDLRLDEQSFLKAVGLELLTWGAFMSRDKGYEGRLLLDASPDFVWWYEQKAHLQKLGLNPMLFEGVEYTPMELPASGAEKLIQLWEDA